MREYLPFNNYIVRTPLFKMEDLYKQIPEDIFSEAIYIASPDLYEEFYVKKRQEKKYQLTLYKYISRACSRCTPFGLFAGCSVGHWNTSTQMILCPPVKYRRQSKIDSELLCNIIEKLKQDITISLRLKYFSNDSIYQHGNVLHYIEYDTKNNSRIHKTIRIDNSVYIQKIILRASHGATLEELAKTIINEEIDEDIAKDFILQLIDNQLLKTEIDISVLDTNPLQTLISKLKQYKISSPLLDGLQEIDILLHAINTDTSTSNIEKYNKILQIIQRFEIPYRPKAFIQMDLFKPSLCMTLSKKMQTELRIVVKFLTKISIFSHSPLYAFRKSFFERYEYQEVDLLKVLDPETGLGYPYNANSYNADEFINDIGLPKVNKTQAITVSPWEQVLLKKYIQAIKTNKQEIILEDSDILNDENIELPDTISIVASIFENDRFYIKNGGGSSGSILLGRFCHLDQEIYSLVQRIHQKEEQLNPDAIFAEIAHLPEPRVGNILMRPNFHEFEICYLYGYGKTKHLPLSDLVLSIKNGQLILSSKHYKKRVIPISSCAHQYSASNIPVYRFLCDMQLQNKHSGLFFKWGNLFNHFDYLPRVIYRNHVLSRQLWKLNKIDFETLYSVKSDEKLIIEASRILGSKNIPQLIVIVEGDNELFLDLGQVISLNILLSYLKKHTTITIEEFLLKNSPIKDSTNTGSFVNEFIFPFYKYK